MRLNELGSAFIMILGNTGKLNFSSIKCVKKKKTKNANRWRSFLGILDFFCWEEWQEAGSSFVQKIMFLVAFGEIGASLFAGVTFTLSRTSKNTSKKTCGYMETKKTFKFTPLFLKCRCQCVLFVFSWHIDGWTGWQTLLAFFLPQEDFKF